MITLLNPISLPLHELLPAASLFTHASRLHGRAHVARTLIHAFILITMRDHQKDAPPLWTAVYLHDLARTHDGKCHSHGADAVRKYGDNLTLRRLFSQGGLQEEQYPAVFAAVEHHARPEELPERHPHRGLTALLKDADGLDRVRINDLNPAYLRFAESRKLVAFAQWLFDATPTDRHEDPDFFARMWDIANEGLARLAP